jgi:hypothetical protein
MPIESGLASDEALVDGSLQAAVALGDVSPRQLGMVEVVHESAPVHDLSIDPEVVEPGAEIRILTDTPAFELLVEAVDVEDVRPPHGEIAAEQPVHVTVPSDSGDGETDGLERSVEPPAPEESLDGRFTVQHLIDESFRN